MARIAGVNIPNHQHTEIGLTAIFGVGRTRARNICVSSGVEFSKKVKDHVSFDPDSRAKTYEIQLTTADPLVGPWETKARPTASTETITGLTSGQRVWVRVRGIGTKGEGPWSDPATKIVP